MIRTLLGVGRRRADQWITKWASPPAAVSEPPPGLAQALTETLAALRTLEEGGNEDVDVLLRRRNETLARAGAELGSERDGASGAISGQTRLERLRELGRELGRLDARIDALLAAAQTVPASGTASALRSPPDRDDA
jgi:hypothetical protein